MEDSSMKSKRNLSANLFLYLKGISMGAADVVPGVSGGTIAFITGIYEELIGSIKSAGTAVRNHLLKGQLKAFFQAINGPFLAVLFAGIATSILLLSNVVIYLLEHQPVAIWSFFFGLIIASAVVVYKKIRNHGIAVIGVALVGVAIAYWVTIASPAETPTDLWFIFLCGAIAICAMILPGISGSFILLLMGKYEFILGSLKELKIEIILVFISGCVVGISLFAHLLDWLLKKYHDMAVALLAGFMIGSLNKVWPWKQVLTTRIDSHGNVKPLLEANISPFHYMEITGNAPNIVIAAVLCLAGFFVVYFLEFRSSKIAG